MLDILLNLDNYPFLVILITYLILCQSLAKLKGFKHWYIEGIIYGLSIPLMVVGICLGVYKLLGGY